MKTEPTTPQESIPASLNVSIAGSEPFKKTPQSTLKPENAKPSSTIIFSIVNSTIGSNIILLPLSIASSGILTSLIVAVIIGLVSYRTCQLTHLHAKAEEVDYINTIHRIMGKAWKYLYSANSIIILFFVCIIYFLRARRGAAR